MEETTLTGIYAVIIIWAGFFIILFAIQIDKIINTLHNIKDDLDKLIKHLNNT